MSLVPVVTVDALPEPYRRYGLKFTFNSAAKLKEWTGCNILAGDNPLGSVVPIDGERTKFVMDPERLRSMLAACLYHRDRRINPDETGDLITADNYSSIADGVMRAYAAYFGKTLEELTEPAESRPTPEATEKSPSASSASGPSVSTTSESLTAYSGA